MTEREKMEFNKSGGAKDSPPIKRAKILEPLRSKPCKYIIHTCGSSLQMYLLYKTICICIFNQKRSLYHFVLEFNWRFPDAC